MNEPLLAFNKEPIVGTRPFDGDALNRAQLADKLTGYINSLKAGAVLAIDAPWGEGKTWFGRNWAKKLENEGYRVAYIDAFEQDYIEDPFILLAAELLGMVEDKSQAKMLLTKKATNVAKATFSISAKIGMGLLTKYALGGVDLGEEIEGAISDASEESANLSSKWIEDSFAKHDENKNTIVAFKDELTKYASSQEKPIVIFIDELDRCKPDFAVSLIERIKHFFDVPNVVFVLLLNRDQLEKAVKGVYGSETDGAAYLGKFVNFFFRLPKSKATDYHGESDIERFVVTTFHKYKFPEDGSNAEIVRLFIFFSVQFDLSPRDIERAIALYAFAYPVHELNQILIYFIILKQKDPSFFQKLVDNDLKAHNDMKVKLDYLLGIDEEKNGSNHHTLSVFKEWHEAHASSFSTLGEKFKKIHGLLAQTRYDIKDKDMFSYFAKKIDLNMER